MTPPLRYCPHCMQPYEEGNYCASCGKDLHVKAGPTQLPVGTILESGISRYQIGVALGQGGFGITYIAMDLRSHQRVAVKEYFPMSCGQRDSNGVSVIAKPGMEDVFQGGRRSFLKEAQTLASLEKMPGIVEIYNYFETNGTAYLVMEYLNGKTLKKMVATREKIAVDEFLPKLPPLINSIARIHEQNVIHRDISPDNIMWMPDGSLKLLDFGCARSMEDRRSLTIMYKPGFAPVEQYLSSGQGTWTDVYALCATIYYCITGKTPQASVDRLDNDRLLPPGALGVSLPEELESALMWGLAVQPKERPVNMEAFAFRFRVDTYYPHTGGNNHHTEDDGRDGPQKDGRLKRLRRVLPANPAICVAILAAIVAAAVFLLYAAFS